MKAFPLPRTPSPSLTRTIKENNRPQGASGQIGPLPLGEPSTQPILRLRKGWGSGRGKLKGLSPLGFPLPDLPRAPLPGLLLPIFAALSLCAWLLPLWAAGVILAGALAAGLRLGILKRSQRGKLKAYAFFLLFWGLSAFLLQSSVGGLYWQAAAANAGALALRLSALAALTLDLNLLLTPFALAEVTARYLRPLVGETRAERAALSLAVMLRLIPQVWHCLQALQNTRKLRCAGLPVITQLRLMTETALRSLLRLAWQQSLALAARDIHLGGECPPCAPQGQRE